MKKLLAIVMMLVLLSVGALAEGTLTTQGVGVVMVNADRATISLDVRETAVDVQTAQTAVNEKMNAVIEAMREAGVAEGDLATNGIGIYANYDYSMGEELTGYTAYNSVVVTVADVDNVGAYIDAAFAAGANGLDYVQFFAVDTAEAADQALALAVEDARHKAGVLADAAGVKLGELREIRNALTDSYIPDNGFATKAEADAGAGTPVLASRQQVSASVTLVFDIDGE